MIAKHLQAQIATNLRDRAQDLAPNTKVEVTFDALSSPSPATTTPVLATVRPKSSEPPPGYHLADRRPAAHHVPLHAFLDASLPGLGWPFRSSGPLHHVGGRPCAHRIPGLVEEIWIASNFPLTTSPPHPLFIRAATVGPIGHLPVVGATIASAIPPILAALAVTLLPWNAVLALTAILAVTATILCLLAESAATRYFRDPDAREFVLDEVAGAAIAVLFVPADHIASGLVLAFATFRLFDVLKPGIQWIELQPWPGKVAWDDVAAGLYAGLATALITFLL